MQCILLESSLLLCSPNVISYPFCTQTSQLSYPVSNPVSHLVPLFHPEVCAQVSVTPCISWSHQSLDVATCDLPGVYTLQSIRHVGHSKNWDKSGRSRTAFTVPDLGSAKLHWLHIHSKRTCSRITSALLSQSLQDSVGKQPIGKNRDIIAYVLPTTTYSGIYCHLRGLTFNSSSSWDNRQPYAGWVYFDCRLDAKTT